MLPARGRSALNTTCAYSISLVHIARHRSSIEIDRLSTRHDFNGRRRADEYLKDTDGLTCR